MVEGIGLDGIDVVIPVQGLVLLRVPWDLQTYIPRSFLLQEASQTSMVWHSGLALQVILLKDS